MQKAYLETLGCRLNQTETAIIAKNLEREGMQCVENPQDADLIVVNTCTVTSQTDAKCRKTIRSLQKKNPSAKIVAVGCYAQNSANEIEKIPGVSLILGNQDKLNLHKHLPEIRAGSEKINRVVKIRRQSFSLEPDAQKRTSTRMNLKIQDGCDFMCAFCVIPFVRGRSRSRNFENLLAEARYLTSCGVKEIILTGVNIGLYKYEDKNFLSLLDALEKIPDLYRIRISSIEPTTIGKEIFSRMDDSTSKLSPYLHLPLQASSDEILKGMRRRYDLEYFVDFIETAKKEVRDICIGSDIIVGFPGETDEIFENSLENLTNMPVDYFHIFPYSERKKTRSLLMSGQVSPSEIKKRIQILKAIDERKRSVFYSSFVGRNMSVLFESGEKDGYRKGLTENYLRIYCRDSTISEGEVYSVRIHECINLQLCGKILETMPERATA